MLGIGASPNITGSVLQCFSKAKQDLKMLAQYSNDLRWQMIFHRVFYQHTCKEIASQLFVSTKTVYRTYQTFINTGDVKPSTLG